MKVSLTPEWIELPGLVSAHSHAFQRALRGRGQRKGPDGEDDFWSWRTSMYELASSLTPETLYSISRVAYDELYRRGVRTVGEFHYVHHQPTGEPYEQRTLLSDTVIRAARDSGLSVALLRVVYERAGKGRPLEGAQRRFCDRHLEDALQDVEVLRKAYSGDPHVRIGIAPHSVRAVSPAWLREIARSVPADIPIHMHVAEQPREIEEARAETGYRPVELIAECGLLRPTFVAVHATHLADNEFALLGAANCFVCVCPTTERDLGDGLPDICQLLRHGVALCVGVDSHVLTNPLEDIRGVELGERLRSGKRVVVHGPATIPAESLWEIGSTFGARACGFGPPSPIRFDRKCIDLRLVDDAHLLDALVFGVSALDAL